MRKLWIAMLMFISTTVAAFADLPSPGSVETNNSIVIIGVIVLAAITVFAIVLKMRKDRASETIEEAKKGK